MKSGGSKCSIRSHTQIFRIWMYLVLCIKSCEVGIQSTLIYSLHFLGTQILINMLQDDIIPEFTSWNIHFLHFLSFWAGCLTTLKMFATEIWKVFCQCCRIIFRIFILICDSLIIYLYNNILLKYRKSHFSDMTVSESSGALCVPIGLIGGPRWSNDVVRVLKLWL